MRPGSHRSRPPKTNVRLLCLGFVAICVLAAGCSDVETAGNATIRFEVNLQTGNYEAAYERLCEANRSRQSLQAFADEHGGEFGDMAAGGGVGRSRQYLRDEETQSDEITEAWTEVEGERGNALETWRVHLKKEDGKWHLCSVELVNRKPMKPRRFETGTSGTTGPR